MVVVVVVGVNVPVAFLTPRNLNFADTHRRFTTCSTLKTGGIVVADSGPVNQYSIFLNCICRNFTFPAETGVRRILIHATVKETIHECLDSKPGRSATKYRDIW